MNEYPDHTKLINHIKEFENKYTGEYKFYLNLYKYKGNLKCEVKEIKDLSYYYSCFLYNDSLVLFTSNRSYGALGNRVVLYPFGKIEFLIKFNSCFFDYNYLLNPLILNFKNKLKLFNFNENIEKKICEYNIFINSKKNFSNIEKNIFEYNLFYCKKGLDDCKFYDYYDILQNLQIELKKNESFLKSKLISFKKRSLTRFFFSPMEKDYFKQTWSEFFENKNFDFECLWMNDTFVCSPIKKN